ARGVDRPAGRVEDGARLARGVRRQADQQLPGVARVLRPLPARPRRLAPPARAAEPRPADAALVLRLALVLQPRRRVRGDAARLPRPLLGGRALPLDRPAQPAAPVPRGLAGLAARRGDGLRRRLPRRPERAGVERDRRRLLGRDRRRPDPARGEPVRALPDRGRPPRLRPSGRGRRDQGPHPDERPLRVRERPRRHVRPGVVRGVHPRLRRVRVERQVGHAPVRARDLDPLGPPLPARPRPRREAARRGAPRSGARVRLGRVAVLAVRLELEHERRDPAGAPRVGLLLRHLRRGARRVRRARLLGEVRAAPARPPLVGLPRRAPPPAARRLRRRLRRGDARRVRRAPARAVAVARGGDLRPPHLRLPVRPRLAVLALGLAAVPRARPSRPPPRPGRADGASARRDAGARVVAAPPLAAPAGRLHVRPARRLRARAHALVLPLPAVVLSLRRDRAARGLTVAVAVAVFLGSWELLHHGRYARDQLSDIPVYEGYGFAMRNGLLPYRDIPVEYPPGALPAFAAPTYAGGYAATFGWLMAACGAGCLVLAALAGARPEALGFLAVSPLLVGSLALSRFDFWPELFVVAGVAFLVRDRHRPAFAALGAAVATKLYALALVPLALAWTWRRRGPRELGLATACGVAVVAAALLPFAILAPDGLWRSVWGESSRPLQVESLGAAVLMTFGHPTVISTHGSLNLAGQGALATASTAVQLAALAALWVAFARGQAAPARLLRYAAACLCAFVALGKVLSP